MLWTVEAEVNVDGTVRLLEAIVVSKPSRAIRTLLGPVNGHLSKSNGAEVLRFLRENRLPEEARPSMEEIEQQISEARES